MALKIPVQNQTGLCMQREREIVALPKSEAMIQGHAQVPLLAIVELVPMRSNPWTGAGPLTHAGISGGLKQLHTKATTNKPCVPTFPKHGTAGLCQVAGAAGALLPVCPGGRQP